MTTNATEAILNDNDALLEALGAMVQGMFENPEVGTDVWDAQLEIIVASVPQDKITDREEFIGACKVKVLQASFYIAASLALAGATAEWQRAYTEGTWTPEVLAERAATLQEMDARLKAAGATMTDTVAGIRW